MVQGLRQILAGLFLILACVAPMAGAQDSKNSGSLAPTLKYTTVTGDEQKFREDWWTREGWAGGFDELSFERKFRNDLSLSFEGLVIVPEEDYRLRMKMAREDRGYFLVEYTEFRKYFDGTGGFYRPFEASPFELGKDLHLDVGDFRLEVGLTQPGLPKLAVWYEHRFKEGSESLLGWGRVIQADNSKNIFPSFKDVSEETDVIGLDVEHAIGKVQVGDNFRYERYRTDTKRFDEERNAVDRRSRCRDVPEQKSQSVRFRL